MTLPEFLLARIAEDEAVARLVPDFRGDEAWPATAIGFAALHGPARVLSECEAKRQIVELHGVDCYAGSGPDGDDEYFCEGCSAPTAYHPAEVRCPTLIALALPYADHPDYREEWKP